MRMTSMPHWILAAAACLIGCTPSTDEGGSEETSTGDSTTMSTTAPTAGSASTDTLDASTSGSGGDTTSTSNDSASSATGSDTGGDTGSDGSSSGGEQANFERFQMDFAAGPCPPGEDCDSFVELLGDGTLNVEEYGDVTNTVHTAQVSAQDLADAVLIFTDPALVALLEPGKSPCVPPTDIFEMMQVEIDGVLYLSPVTACNDAPIAAARSKATQLQVMYVP
jgi:hypothetical protein